jgi:molecular chaperone DnaK
MSDLTRWSIGISSRAGAFIIIIPKDTILPAKRRIVVTTVEDEQPNIGLDIRMGDSSKAAENYPFSYIRLDGVEKAPKGVPRVKLTFYAYNNSICNIGVRYKEDDPEQILTIFPSFGLSSEEVSLIHKKVAKMAEDCQPVELETLTGAVIPLPAIG